MSDETVEVRFYLQVKAERGYSGNIFGAKAVKMTQNRPETVVGDARVYRLTFLLPKSEFIPQTITAEVTNWETGEPLLSIEDTPPTP